MDYRTLNNGVKMPVAGFGVFQIPLEETKQAVLDALEAGYRLIDTAQSYMNERKVGEALSATAIAREEIFVTTKVWVSNYGYELTRQTVLGSMKRLQTDYLDLVLLHQALGDYYGSWRALEELQADGKIRAIGVSNFNPKQLADLIAFNRRAPQVNQIEINPFHQQEKEVAYAEKMGVQVEAWAPFAEGKNGIFSNEILVEIGKQYGKTAGQVILRWLIERSIIPVSKSTKIARMRENSDIFDFELTADDMKKIATLNDEKSQFFDMDTPEMVEMFQGFIASRQPEIDRMNAETKEI
jgi:diketogulonate reductase-like aldo/keto reductase